MPGMLWIKAMLLLILGWWGHLVCPVLSSSWSKMEKQWLQPINHIFLPFILSILPSLCGGEKDPEPQVFASAFAALCPFPRFQVLLAHGHAGLLKRPSVSPPNLGSLIAICPASISPGSCVTTQHAARYE